MMLVRGFQVLLGGVRDYKIHRITTVADFEKEITVST